MTTPDPTEYLLARYAEDEEVARRAAFGWGGDWRSETDDAEEWSVVLADGKRDMVGCEDGDVTQHIARHDPARVLADIKAERAVVDIHCATDMLWGEHVELGCPQCGDPFEGWLWTHPCPTLRALLQPYADRPDFPDEWRTT